MPGRSDYWGRKQENLGRRSRTLLGRWRDMAKFWELRAAVENWLRKWPRCFWQCGLAGGIFKWSVEVVYLAVLPVGRLAFLDLWLDEYAPAYIPRLRASGPQLKRREQSLSVHEAVQGSLCVRASCIHNAKAYCHLAWVAQIICRKISFVKKKRTTVSHTKRQ